MQELEENDKVEGLVAAKSFKGPLFVRLDVNGANDAQRISPSRVNAGIIRDQGAGPAQPARPKRRTFIGEAHLVLLQFGFTGMQCAAWSLLGV